MMLQVEVFSDKHCDIFYVSSLNVSYEAVNQYQPFYKYYF